MPKIHLRVDGRTICPVDRSRRWLSTQITSTKSITKTNCAHCKRGFTKIPLFKRALISVAAIEERSLVHAGVRLALAAMNVPTTPAPKPTSKPESSVPSSTSLQYLFR